MSEPLDPLTPPPADIDEMVDKALRGYLERQEARRRAEREHADSPDSYDD